MDSIRLCSLVLHALFHVCPSIARGLQIVSSRLQRFALAQVVGVSGIASAFGVMVSHLELERVLSLVVLPIGLKAWRGLSYVFAHSLL